MPFILDSAQSNDGLGDWSFFGAEPFRVFSGGSLSDLRLEMSEMKGDFGGPTEIPFTGGAVGYLAYDYGRRLEQMSELSLDDRDIPDTHFALYDGVAALHRRTGKLYLVAHGLREPVDAILTRLQAWLVEPIPASIGALSLSDW
ncbi:MAG: hypothetical protein AAF709_24730, partial [Pseudomonadota bacterium]